MILKDGTYTLDKRFDRLVSFDTRSRAFSVVRKLVRPKYKTRLWACRQTLDQGEEGACVGAGVTHELIAEPCEVIGLDMKFAREVIYWGAQMIDDWIGGSYPGAEPEYEGTSVLAGCKMAKKLGYIDSYDWAFGLDELIFAVGNYGPAVLGLMWYSGMYKTDDKFHIHASGYIAGGHCILCRGVDVEKEYFTLRNSWGTEWGDNGDCRVSFADMDKLLSEQGEAVFFKGRHLKPEPEYKHELAEETLCPVC